MCVECRKAVHDANNNNWFIVARKFNLHSMDRPQNFENQIETIFVHGKRWDILISL